MEPIYEQSLTTHRLHGGKLSVASKVPLGTKHDLSIAYTPGVAEVSREIGRDKSLAYEYTIKKNSVAVITDGSAILGLGNLGPEAALPVMEGKAILLKEFADVDAYPICLDTQDTEEIIKTVRYLAPGFGAINLEDIGAPRCFEIEARLRETMPIPVMHDDQHGTAVVVLAALINAHKVRPLDKENSVIVISGAGAAGTAVALLIAQYGYKKVIVLDTKGAIFAGRDNLTPDKERLAAVTNPDKVSGNLSDILKGAAVLIGVSQPGLADRTMIATMEARPIVFALANPVPEIMPDEARAGGAYIVATGRSDFPNQINNVLAFPGIFRGALDNKISQFTDEMFLRAAENLAACVTNPTVDQILPDPLDRSVVPAVAKAIY